METAASLHFRDGTYPGQLAWSGLAGVEESLVHGRLVPRMWTSTGFLARGLWPVHGNVQDAPFLPDIRALPAESFDLEMDGQSLQGGWQWLGAGPTREGRPGTESGLIRLESVVRPVSPAVRTTVDGTGFLVRSLEVTNRADRPSALSRLAPWSGMLWGGVGFSSVSGSRRSAWWPRPRWRASIRTGSCVETARWWLSRAPSPVGS